MIPLVYIASPSFSGSTLLTFLLNAHPSIATMGELKWGPIDLETYRCSCGALLRECSWWQEVAARMAARGLPFDLNRPPTDFRCRDHWLSDRVVRARVRGKLFETARTVLVHTLPPPRTAWPLVREVNRALIEIMCELKGARVFVDASKDPVRLKHLHETGDYDLFVLHLIRDGRGVTNSALKNEGRTATEAAYDWLNTHRQIERLQGILGPHRLLRLRYEDLCTDLDGTLERVFSFAGLNRADAEADYRAAEHHILGNQMRLWAAGEIRLDEKWRTMLSEHGQAAFEKVAGELNRRYGYG